MGPRHDKLKAIAQYTSVVQKIEDDHRHDLAVHLFLTHLLHRVDPSFPRPQWLQWPQARLHSSPDPTAREAYEDALGDDELLCETPQDLQPLPAPLPPDVGSDLEQQRMDFRRSLRRVRVRVKHRLRSDSRAVLLSELRAVFLARLRAKLAAKYRLGESYSCDAENSPVVRQAINQLASRLVNTIKELGRKSRNNSTRLRLVKTWQDVYIASLISGRRDGTVNLSAHCKAYKKARFLFHTFKYPYKYDPDAYEDGAVPDFEPQRDPAEVLAKFNQKENYHSMLCNLAVRSAQFQHDASYQPQGDFLLKERTKELQDMQLLKKTLQHELE